MRGLQLVRKGGPWPFLAGYNLCFQGINWQELLGGACISLAHITDVCRRKMAIHRQIDLSAEEIQQKIDLHSYFDSSNSLQGFGFNAKLWSHILQCQYNIAAVVFNVRKMSEFSSENYDGKNRQSKSKAI